MTAEEFRNLALSFAGVEEKSHMGQPDFRANGRIFASLGYPNAVCACIGLTPEQQQERLEASPDAFSQATGAWGRAGWTVVHLNAVDWDSAGAALTYGYQSVMAKAPPKPRAKPVAKKAVKKAAKRTAKRRA